MRKIRAALYAVYFLGVTLAFGLAAIVVRIFARHLALGFAQAWVRTLLAGLRPVCGITIEVCGLANLPISGPALLACQHQSEFDTLVWMHLLRRPSYVMKQELLHIPLVGPMLVPAGMIPVDRTGGAAALRRLLQAAAAARDDGRQIVIFPEGTRVPPGERVELQPGIAAVASRLRLPVIPVATDSGLHWTRAALGRFPGPIHIAIGPPVPAGTSREKLLSDIEAFWRRAEVSRYQVVDNSVEQVTVHPAQTAMGGG